MRTAKRYIFMAILLVAVGYAGQFYAADMGSEIFDLLNGRMTKADVEELLGQSEENDETFHSVYEYEIDGIMGKLKIRYDDGAEYIDDPIIKEIGQDAPVLYFAWVPDKAQNEAGSFEDETESETMTEENGQACTDEFSADNISRNDVECMLPAIYTYLNSSRLMISDSTGKQIYDTSYNEEDFWNMMQIYAIFDSSNSYGSYSLDEIRYIAYALFSDYDGTLPAVPETNAVQQDGDTVTFLLATPEEREVSLTEITVLEDGSVDAVFHDSLLAYEDTEKNWAVSFAENEMTDFSSYAPLYYKVVSIESREDQTGQSEEVSDFVTGNGYYAENEYVFPDSDSRYLTLADLVGLDAQTLRYARNEIYARHGRRFSDQELQAYFDGKSWYQGTIEPEDFEESLLSEIEKTNAELILMYENSGS